MGDLVAIRSNWILGLSHFLLSILSAIALKHADSVAPLAFCSFTIIFGYGIYGILHYTYPKELPAWCKVLTNSLTLIVQLLTLTLYTADAVTLQTTNDQYFGSKMFYSYAYLLIISLIHVLSSSNRYYYLKSLSVIAFILWNLVILVQIQRSDWQECSWYNGMILLLILNNVIVRTLFNRTFNELYLIVHTIQMIFFTIFAFKSLNELAFASLNHNYNNRSNSILID